MREPRYADPQTRKRLHDKAHRAMSLGAVPYCHCGRGMHKDSFNGMWHCWEEEHGGYQTQDQVTNILYMALLKGEGYSG